MNFFDPIQFATNAFFSLAFAMTNPVTGTPVKPPDLNPAHIMAVKTSAVIGIVLSTNGPYIAPNGYVQGISWTPSPDTNAIAVRIYAGPDADTALLMFQVPVPGTNTSFFWPSTGTFLVWATAIDGAGDESDNSNYLLFTPPPPHTNIMLSWNPPHSNVWVRGSRDLVNWTGITNVNGSNAVLSITNSPWQFYQLMTAPPSITNFKGVLQ